MPSWTIEQRRAIEAPGSLLVSAGAGSGKTAVLTARIVRLIDQGESINSILCVTFTNAAAAEMKKRIEKSLAAAAAQSQGARAEMLYKAAASANAASISTLHSFCTQVLRRHFAIAGLDPNFRVADAGEAAILRAAAYDELVENRYALGSGVFGELMDALGGDEAAQEAIYSVYDFARSQPDPAAWLDTALGKYSLAEPAELLSSPAAEELLQSSLRSITARCAALQSACTALEEEGLDTLAGFIKNEILVGSAPLAAETPAEFAAALEALSFDKKRISWGGLEGPLRTAADSARKKLKDTIKAERAFWCGTAGSHFDIITKQRPLIAELCSFIKEFDIRFAAKKDEAGCIDYGDMEHKSLLVLKDEEVRQEYARRFKHIFMDEYQDCNPVQESIIQSVAQGADTFFVGDVKQSIYRFRLAEPALFMQRYADYAAKRGGELICLNHNFRSAPGVINAVNGLFGQIMHKATAEIEYDEEAALKCGREGPEDTRAEFLLLDMLDNAWDDDERGAYAEAETDIAAAEAAAAARRIHELMDTQTIADSATGEQRKLKYSDFAVLLRSYKGSAESWMRTLAANGVPAYAMLADGYFDAVEVRIFLDLLRVIDNRRQDIPLAAVLRSPIGGFDEKELIALKADHAAPQGMEKDWAWIDRLALAAQEQSPLGQKARRITQMLDRFRSEAELISTQALIGLLLDETGFGEYCAALPGGRQRQANLEALCDMAQQSAAAGARTLNDFLNYMDKVSQANAYGAPQTGGANVVSIMSIHASKGLEFPYVIIGGMNSQFVREGMDKLICDKALGIGARFIAGDIRQGSFFHAAITASLSAKAAAEEMRVLYVALTRARERIIMLCAAKNGSRLVANALAAQGETALLGQKSFAQWVLGYILHSKSGNPIRSRYGITPCFEADAHIDARCLPVPAALPGGGRMGVDKYRAFVAEAEALARSGAVDAPWFKRSYKNSADIELPGKLSVTALSGSSITELEEAPAFMQSGQPKPAQTGTAVHEIMRAIPLNGSINTQSISELAARLTAAGIMEQAAAAAVPVESIAAFFAGELGQRLLRSPVVRREAEFNLRISAKELLGADTDEPLLLQGVIDCCFIENGEWVLIDYKTDRVPRGASARSVAQKHFTQLALYKKALERLTKTRVKQSYIYLFSIGAAVQAEGEL